MMGNDLSNSPTPRYYVLAEVVFDRSEKVTTKVEGRWRKKERTEVSVVWTPNLRNLSALWLFSNDPVRPVRLEIVFADDLKNDGPELWYLLEDTPTAHPFNDFHVYESRDKIARDLAFRPDLLGVIDLPSKSAIYGGRGLTMQSLR
jgi:hypothetical protein